MHLTMYVWGRGVYTYSYLCPLPRQLRIVPQHLIWRILKSDERSPSDLRNPKTARSTLDRSGSIPFRRRLNPLGRIHYCARSPVVERQQSTEPQALSAHCQDFSPCSVAVGWPRVR